MARLYITDYITYNTISKAKYATWQISLDDKFVNVVAETYKDPVNVLSWLTSINETVYSELHNSQIEEVFARVKLYTDNAESPWYILKLDKTKHDRFYYAGEFLRERIWNRNGILLVDQDFTKDDNPIDTWFYDITFMDDFYENYINVKDWKVKQYIDGDVAYSNNFIDMFTDSNSEGYIRIGCRKDSDGLMGTDLEFKHPIELTNGVYIETRVDFPVEDDAELSVVLTGENVKIVLVEYNPRYKRYFSKVFKNNLGVFNKEIDTGVFNMFGCLLEDNTLKIYMDHKLIGTVNNVKEDTLTLEYIAKPNDAISADVYMDIDYLKTYLRNPDYEIPEEAKLDPLELY